MRQAGRGQAPSSSSPASTASTGRQGPSGQRQYQLTATIPVGNGPGGVAVDPGARTVYVAHAGREGAHGAVSVIDATTHTVGRRCASPRAPAGGGRPGHPHRLRHQSEDGTVTVMDGATLTVTDTVPVGPSPRAVAVDPGSHTVYVGGSGRSERTGHGVGDRRVDQEGRGHRGRRQISRWTGGGSGQPRGLRHQLCRRLCVSDRHLDEYRHRNAGRGPVARHGRGRSGHSQCLCRHLGSRRRRSRYPAAVAQRQGLGDRRSTRTVVATVPIGKSVDAVAVDSATDTVYVAKFADDTVSVIDGSERAVTATVSWVTHRWATVSRWIPTPTPSTSPASMTTRCR